MTRSFAIAVVVLAGALPLLAAPAPAVPDSFVPLAGVADDVTRASYVETFETFTAGPLAGQSGWTGWGANIAVVTDTPISGTKSARHSSDGSGFVGFETVSPASTPAYGITALDVRLSGDGVTYQINLLGDVPTSNDGFYFNTAVQFQTDHTIRVLQSVGSLPVYQNTSGTWAPNSPFQLAVEVLANGTLHVYRNGVSIFTGTEVGFATTGTAGRTKQVLAWTDNAPNFAGQSLTIDNFTNVLSPGPGGCPGDMNCDRAVTVAAIDLLGEALSGQTAWSHLPCPWHSADCSGDGQVTFADIDPFVVLLGTTCP